MKKKRPGRPGRPGRGSNAQPGPEQPRDENTVNALTAAMILAPGVYARNRMFDLFASSAGARRARMRAGIVRGIVRQVGRATAVTLETAQAVGSASTMPPAFILRYQISAVKLTRIVELSAVELAALRLAVERAAGSGRRAAGTNASEPAAVAIHSCLRPDEKDKDIVANALSWLLAIEGVSGHAVTELAREMTVAPPGE